ncbi:MAG: hypothetical protein V8R51_04400 [Clostridia bacterium]
MPEKYNEVVLIADKKAPKESDYTLYSLGVKLCLEMNGKIEKW